MKVYTVQSMETYFFPELGDFWLNTFPNEWLIEKDIFNTTASVTSCTCGCEYFLHRELPSLKENFVVFGQNRLERSSRKFWSLSHRWPVFFGTMDSREVSIWFSEKRNTVKCPLSIEPTKLRFSHCFLFSSRRRRRLTAAVCIQRSSLQWRTIWV